MAVITPVLVSNNIVAFINFDGTGTPSIRASFNILSIVGNGVGDYTINFINNIIDIDYTVLTSIGNIGIPTNSNLTPITPTVSSIRLRAFASATNAPSDEDYLNVAIVR